MNLNARKDGWIVTYTGKKFYPLDPDPDSIDIVDIAHALSNTCRFSGHTKKFYSVAQHSYCVSLLCGEHALYGLLHDASEAYLHDISTPVKHSPEMYAYRDAEFWLQGMILVKYGIRYTKMPPEVKDADVSMGIIEGQYLMPWERDAFWCNGNYEKGDDSDFHIWMPHRAEEKFLLRFDELHGTCAA